MILGRRQIILQVVFQILNFKGQKNVILAFPNSKDREINLEETFHLGESHWVCVDGTGISVCRNSMSEHTALLPRILEEEKEKFSVTSFTVMLLVVQ